MAIASISVSENCNDEKLILSRSLFTFTIVGLRPEIVKVELSSVEVLQRWQRKVLFNYLLGDRIVRTFFDSG